MRRREAALALIAAALTLAPQGAGAQTERAVLRGLELEQQARYADAAVAYREGLASPNFPAALLGLERVLSQLGLSDSLLPVLDSVIRVRPRDALPRTIQLRTLRSLARSDAARQAFERWVKEAPRDPTPYREFARLLIQDGQPLAADSIVQRAQVALGNGRDMAMEMAQLRAAMGLWASSARAWRLALEVGPYLSQAASFSLQPTPAAWRDSVRAILRQPPAVAARRALAMLELAWGAPRDGWAALSDLTPSDSAASAWRDFGDLAEAAEAWLPARDALVAASRWRPATELLLRAATDALNGSDAASALRLLDSAAARGDSAAAARGVLPLRVRALASLGRPAEAQAAITAYGTWLDAERRGQLQRAVAAGWVRRGELDKAREALTAAGGDADQDPAGGWIALYEGDLRTARRLLRQASEASADLVAALALLSRTRADSAPAIGAAFLAMARGDSAGAAARWIAAADAMPELAPLLLSWAGRIQAARHDDTQAVAVWTRLLERHERSPEAAEADLEWGRALLRRGDRAGAAQRMEHLILTYPQSALVPQARRELELIRGGAS